MLLIVFPNDQIVNNISPLVPVNEPEFSLRIVGGHDTKTGQFPYHVSFQIHSKTPSFYRDHHVCSASIISEMWLLTAAHCTEKMFEELDVTQSRYSFIIKAGRHNITNEHEVGEQVVEVDKFFNHKAYVKNK